MLQTYMVCATQLYYSGIHTGVGMHEYDKHIHAKEYQYIYIIINYLINTH